MLLPWPRDIPVSAILLLTLVHCAQGQFSPFSFAEPESEPEFSDETRSGITNVADLIESEISVVDPNEDSVAPVTDVNSIAGIGPGGLFPTDIGGFAGGVVDGIGWAAGIHDINPCVCCVEHAVCINNTCVCDEGHEGDGFFHCVDATKYYYCRSSNDPSFRTLAGENFVHHLIGSTRLAQVTTTRHPEGQCKFWLWGWTKRVKGKYYWSGLTFRLDQIVGYEEDTRRGHVLANSARGEPYTWNVRIYGPDEEFPIADTFSSLDVNPFSSHDVGGCDITYQRHIQDFMYFDISCCGISFAIRQFHPDFYVITPGFYFQVEKSHYPTYETWADNNQHTEPMCLDHLKIFTVNDLIANTGITNGKREALTFHAITNTVFHEYPDAPEGLALLKILLRDCPTHSRDTLFDLIKFFFDNPKLSNCLNGANNTEVTKSIEGIEYAASLVCNDSMDGCEPLTNLVTVPECARVLEQFPQIEHLAYPEMCTGGLHNDFQITDVQSYIPWS